MQILERFAKLLGIIFLILLFFAIKIFIGLVIMAMAIVPFTYIYCKISGRSYNSVLDSSEFLYKANRWGQGAFIVLGALIIFYVLIKLL